MTAVRKPSILVPPGWDDAHVHLQAVASCLECGVLVVNAHQRIALCSPTMASTFGLTVEEVQAMTPSGLIDHIALLVPDPPPVLAERALLPPDGRIICEEFEIKSPARSVVRWVARHVSSPEPSIVVVLTDITTEVDLATAYERLAVTDLLTGLANRRGAEQQVKREMSRAKRYGNSLCFLIADVDHFKRVNDRFGHNVGDEVLRMVSGGLTSALRESDLAARWGGEEFLCMLPSTTLEGARLCAERLRLAVERLEPPGVGRVTISIGAAQLQQTENLNQVLARADERLYEAKASGRNHDSLARLVVCGGSDLGPSRGAKFGTSLVRE